MKAIETIYKNITFRSRLEARWAVFFDGIGIEWVYEDEGFDLGNGIWYLPDFWLPTFNGGMFAEVKPKAFTDFEMDKAARLVDQSNSQMLLCVGMPDFKIMPFLSKEYCQQHEKYKSVGVCYGLPNADQATEENRMFVSPGYENKDGTIAPEYFDCLGERYVSAIRKARSARFLK